MPLHCTEPAIQLENVSKTFGDKIAVSNMNLTVPYGSIYGVIGPNGSGKTTTLRMILRIYQPTSGTVTVLGERGRRSADDRVGYLPEERGLYRRMTVRRTLRYFARLKGCRTPDATIEKWMRFLKAEDWYGKRMDQLSKGMAQKVQFVAAIASNPDVIILDEPFSGLDPVNADLIRAAMLQLREEGATLLLSTHDMSIAESLCDRVCMIFRGQKVLDGTLPEIHRRHGGATTRIAYRPNRPLPKSFFMNLPGFERFGTSIVGESIYLHFNRDAPKRRLLSTLLEHGEVERLETASPTLHEIFVSHANRPEASNSTTNRLLHAAREVHEENVG